MISEPGNFLDFAFAPKIFVSFPRIQFPETTKLRIRGFFCARKNSCRTCHQVSPKHCGSKRAGIVVQLQANRDFSCVTDVTSSFGHCNAGALLGNWNIGTFSGIRPIGLRKIGSTSYRLNHHKTRPCPRRKVPRATVCGQPSLGWSPRPQQHRPQPTLSGARPGFLWRHGWISSASLPFSLDCFVFGGRNKPK